MLHNAWEAPRLRALNEVLGVELQPEELLLGPGGSGCSMWGGGNRGMKSQVVRGWRDKLCCSLEGQHQRG